MRRIGLAWDLGAGRGHAVRLAALARHVRERGDEPVLFARNLRTLRAAFDGDVPALLPAPHNDWVPRDAAPASWADILWSEAGLHDEAQAVAIALAWRDVLAASRVQALLADAAPLAACAARSLGIRCVAIGTGFLVPPAGPPWPVFRSWEAVDAARVAQREDAVRDRMRAVHEALGLQPCGTFAATDAQALFTYPALDHYPTRGSGAHIRHVGPMLGRGERTPWPDGARRVLVYLSATHPLLAALDAALPALAAVLDAPGVTPERSTSPADASGGALGRSTATPDSFYGALEPSTAMTDSSCGAFETRAAEGDRPIPRAEGRDRPIAVLAHFGGAQPWANRPGLHIASRPVDIATALSQAELVVTAGGNLAIAAAAHGVPSLLLPTQAETYLTALRLASLGAAIACTDGAALPAALAAALGDTVARGARTLGATLPVRDDTAIADDVLDLLG